MSNKKTIEVPAIEEIKLSSLVIDTTLSGRNDKEIRDNAKALAPQMAASGGWDARQPGQYFERGGKKHLAAGFTRVAAADLNGQKTGYFVRVEDDPAKLRTSAIRTNTGKPISAFEQGRIYAGMRDGGNAETAAVGEEMLAPMTAKEIADEMGVSRQHIDNTIAIFEETPEIAELITSGKVSANIATRAKQLVKADGKRLAFLKAAVKQAASDGKETATMKHLDAVKPEFAPLKAKETKDAKGEAPEPPIEAPSGGKPAKKGKADAPEAPAAKQAQSALDLGSTHKPATNTQHEAYDEVVDRWGKERGVVFSVADRDNLVDALVSLPY